MEAPGHLKSSTHIACDVREGRCKKHGRRPGEGSLGIDLGPRARHTREFDHQVARFARVADKTTATWMFRIDLPPKKWTGQEVP